MPPKPRKSRKVDPSKLTSIRQDEIYPLTDFRRRLGIGDQAVRRMKRDGLKIIRIGNLRLVTGADFFEFLALKNKEGQ